MGKPEILCISVPCFYSFRVFDPLFRLAVDQNGLKEDGQRRRRQSFGGEDVMWALCLRQCDSTYINSRRLFSKKRECAEGYNCHAMFSNL